MPRAPSSIKEKIAERRFLQAVDPRLIVQLVSQGNDFGTDALVKVFSESGTYLRRFNVQVKYASPRRVGYAMHRRVRPWDLDTYVPVTHILLHDLDLSLAFYHQYTNPAVSGSQATLLFCANDETFFYCWLDDLHDYFLQWLPRARRRTGTFRIWLNNVRSYYRTEVGHLLAPGTSGFETATESHIRHGATFDHRPINEWAGPNTVDSLENLALSIYLQYPRPGLLDLKGFRTDAFWLHFYERLPERPWLALVFARVLGVLPPCEAMATWAGRICAEWADHLALPAALRVVSHSAEKQVARGVAERIHSLVLSGTIYPRMLELIAAGMRRQEYEDAPGATSRREEELIASTVWLLTERIVHAKCDVSQAALVEMLRVEMIPVHLMWLVAGGLRFVATHGGFLNTPSYQVLRQACGVTKGRAVTPAAIRREMMERDEMWTK